MTAYNLSLYLPTKSQFLEFTQVAANVMAFAVGSNAMLIIKSDGTVFGVGSNQAGTLGYGPDRPDWNMSFVPARLSK